MIPVIAQLGPFPLNSFGLMMVCAFLAGWRRLYLSLQQAGEDPALAERMVFWAAAGGILGARINYLLSFPAEVQADPWGTIFGGAGFVFWGGFLGGALGAGYIVKRAGRPFLTFADLTSPTLALGYAIGRLGCQLSGDGDYGTVSSLPWAMGYPLGVVPTPPGVLVHPAPVYETFAALALAFLLLALQRRAWFQLPGRLFGLYLLIAGASRLLVEFVRIEPIVAWGLTQAQWAGIAVMIAGAVLLRPWRAAAALNRQ